jgi:hypothetical protein
MKEEDVRQLKELDEAKISKLHWKIVFVSGLGFFTDAYEALRQRSPKFRQRRNVYESVSGSSIVALRSSRDRLGNAGCKQNNGEP